MQSFASSFASLHRHVTSFSELFDKVPLRVLEAVHCIGRCDVMRHVRNVVFCAAWGPAVCREAYSINLRWSGWELCMMDPNRGQIHESHCCQLWRMAAALWQSSVAAHRVQRRLHATSTGRRVPSCRRPQQVPLTHWVQRRLHATSTARHAPSCGHPQQVPLTHRVWRRLHVTSTGRHVESSSPTGLVPPSPLRLAPIHFDWVCALTGPDVTNASFSSAWSLSSERST